MRRLIYLNGTYCAPDDAKISIFDRGLLFADAVYEVAGVLDGKLIDFYSHMQRLDRSLAAMRIESPLTHAQILQLMRELVRLNEVDQGMIYLQITRGSDGDRDFLPSDKMTPTVFAFSRNPSLRAAGAAISCCAVKPTRLPRRFAPRNDSDIRLKLMETRNPSFRAAGAAISSCAVRTVSLTLSAEYSVE